MSTLSNQTFQINFIDKNDVEVIHLFTDYLGKLVDEISQKSKKSERNCLLEPIQNDPDFFLLNSNYAIVKVGSYQRY